MNDLIGKPFTEMRCGEVVSEGLRRMGLTAAAEALPTSQESALRFLDALRDSDCLWQLVGTESCQARPGDILASPEPEGWHVSLCTDRLYALTSTRRHGVHKIRLGRMRSVEAVYRWATGVTE